MSTVNLELECPLDGNLERVIEPLASYICAADRPWAALASALAILFNEVKETNRAAVACCGDFLENHWS